MTCCTEASSDAQSTSHPRAWSVALAVIALLSLAMSSRAQDAPVVSSFSITGVVKSGTTPIPGATVTATNAATQEALSTSTDINGSYALSVSAQGKYHLRVEMPAFAPSTREIVLGESNTRADLELTLQSRTQSAANAPHRSSLMSVCRNPSRRHAS